MSKLQLTDGFNFNRSKKLFLPDNLDLKGTYIVEHHREGKLLDTYRLRNQATNVGKNYLLNAGFNSGSIIAQSAWCISLVDNSGFTSFLITDTMSAHGTWAEFTTYTQSTRVAWGPGTTSSQLVTNASLALFDISANGILQGIFITSQNTKGGTTGILWATSPFPSPVPVIASVDEIKITYNLAI